MLGHFNVGKQISKQRLGPGNTLARQGLDPGSTQEKKYWAGLIVFRLVLSGRVRLVFSMTGLKSGTWLGDSFRVG